MLRNFMLNLQPTASIGSLMLRGNHTPQANNFPLPVTIYCLLLSPRRLQHIFPCPYLLMTLFLILLKNSK